MMSITTRVPFSSRSPDGCLLLPRLPLPSTPAVYTLRFSLRRPGWSVLTREEKLVVRPRRHDEYERFLGVAWPYYVSWGSLVVATVWLLIPMLMMKSGVSVSESKDKRE